MMNSDARAALENAKVNANNTIVFARKLESTNKDHAKAIESIGFSLHAIARALEALNR